jgi:hypothetical protein
MLPPMLGELNSRGYFPTSLQALSFNRSQLIFYEDETIKGHDPILCDNIFSATFLNIWSVSSTKFNGKR